ncbi:hypothetical protein Poli38472_007279 [Pythium oligandrum]|uniref:Uncharacterized protein n=1 Tax=Pythium oligandrum TaxID=41045 RepID=A0A8K1C9V8_PYTOL|nr:hypothetical protein Poli38472_007279 [Pythium oligandrum]|eukprot:TMW59134.1 hypothetical protein Poli38472_007279 [Pythium oligandrum]
MAALKDEHGRESPRVRPDHQIPRGDAAAGHNVDGSVDTKVTVDEDIAMMETPFYVDTTPGQNPKKLDRDVEAKRQYPFAQRPQAPAHSRTLTTVALFCLYYFTVCGGPVGTELSVSTGGPLLGLVGYIAFPILFNIPIAYAIAELCSSCPEDGGFAIWILNTFGPFWGFLEGYWAWIGSVLDRILYVNILYGYLNELLDFSSLSSVAAYMIKAGMALGLTIPSLFGSRTFSLVLTALLVLVIIPVLVFMVDGFVETHSLDQLGDVRVAGITVFDDGEGSTDVEFEGPMTVDWTVWINTLFWNLDGFYYVSVFGGQVANAAQAYPKAILWSGAVMWLSYVLPMLAAVGANTPHWSTWDEDAYPSIAQAIGGDSLYGIVLIGAIAGAVGMFLAEVYCEALQIWGMASCGLLPKIFQQREARFETPLVAIFFSFVIVLLGLTFDLNAVMGVKNALAGAVELLILAAAVKMRQELPDIPRPTKIPGPWIAMCVILAPSAFLLVFLVVNVMVEPTSAIAFLVITAVGGILAAIQHWNFRRYRVVT